ncbi:unnamed protein product [Caenorhabditis auriculariae]|uniref:Protein kinase domain-containing protein n=1 Tax=Caenorhabditis auriculariae TaxID=2777116 RepID=A0A8S1GM73_9PELO|nr:unnamed protein product [Caenorhabditis auriculariae]
MSSQSHECRLLPVGKTIELQSRKWKVESLISSGPFSSVYLVEQDGMPYAMKVEKQDGCMRPVLKLDHAVLSRLSGVVGFPQLAASGRTTEFKYVVMQLVGPDIATLLHMMPSKRFSQSTVYKYALQTLERIRVLHGAGWLNRDLKTHNFAVGLGSDSSTVYMLDFGLTRRYRDDSGTRFLLRGYGPCVGTFPYAPLASASFMDQTPADDLEGWLYMIVHLLRGGLPWHNQRVHLDIARCREWKIYARRETGKRRLFSGLPSGWISIFNSIIALNASDTPDYNKISRTIVAMAQQNGIDLSVPFDWQTNPTSRMLLGLTPLSEELTLSPTQTFDETLVSAQ